MKLRDWIEFTLLGLLWGSSFLWIKIGVQEIGPFVLVAVRLLIGGAALGAVLAVRRQALPGREGPWGPLLFLGIINTALPFVLISWGEKTVDSAVASVINSTVPLFVLLLAHFFLRDEPFSFTRLLGLGVGFVGVVVLAARQTAAAGADPAGWTGYLAILLGALCYAISAVYVRRNLKGVSSHVQAFVPLISADAAVWLGAATVEAPIRLPALPATWVAVTWLGLLGSCAAYLLYFRLIHNIGATRTSVVVYVIALVGVALGVVVLGEKLDWRLAVGTVCVIAAAAIVNRRSSTIPRPSPQNAES
jgi:drug/metabolite transporter (DMT)-like permease